MIRKKKLAKLRRRRAEQRWSEQNKEAAKRERTKKRRWAALVKKARATMAEISRREYEENMRGTQYEPREGWADGSTEKKRTVLNDY